MKKGILILICFCCFSGISYGQNKKVDSLLQVLRTAKEDTAKVNTLITLADEFKYNNPDTAIYFANEAKIISIKLNYKMGLANAFLKIGSCSGILGNNEKALKNNNDALLIFDQVLAAGKTVSKSNILNQKARVYNNIGNILTNQGKFSEALKNHSASLKIREEIGDKEGISMSHNNIGIIYTSQGNYPEGLKNFLASLKIDKELGDKMGEAISFGNIGLIYMNQGNYPEALKNYFASLKISEEIRDKNSIRRNYLNIGVIYKDQGNYPEALKNFFASLKLCKELDDKPGIASALQGIGLIYWDEGNYPEALNNLFAALKIYEELGYKTQIASNLSNIGIIFGEQGNFTESLKNHFAALKISEETDNKELMAGIFGNIGETYRKLKQNKDASRYMAEGLALSKEIGNISFIKDCYQRLVALDSAQGNFKQAFEDHKMYIVYRDSLVNKETAKKTIQIQMEYEFDKKESLEKAEQEKKNTIALKELQRQKLLRNFFIGMVGLVFVLFFLIYRTYRSRQMLRLNDIRNKIASDLHDDIGSTLNSISIYSEVAKNKDENYDEALEMIGDASRKVIEAMSDIVWTINAENDSFEKIIFRMTSLAYNLFRAKNIEFTFHADEILNEKKLSIEERRNFYLIFKEAVNNLVKYSNATHASITLTNENDQIILRIRDDGVGFNTSQDNAGNGLKNMKRRAEEMDAEFQIESQTGKGTQIELILKA